MFFNHMVLILGFVGVIQGNSLDSEVQKWAGSLGETLFQFTKNTTAYTQVLDKYQDPKYFDFVNINGTKIMNDFAQSFESLLQSKTKALLRVKKAVEDAQATYTYESNLKYDYRNIKYINTDNKTLVIYPYFSTSLKVNKTYSYIQVPTNVYEKDPAVLNTAKMTEKLDEVYRNNFQEDKTLLWQYYGDAKTGTFRTYPSKVWARDSSNRDLYDCRQRNWFILASSSPKDLIIIIDQSGTMIGNNFGIAKVSALVLIDALQENDFFNVMTFNTQVTYAFPNCKTELMQATKENKEAAKSAVNKFGKPNKTGDVEKVMEAALKIMMNVRGNSKKSAGCNQAIAFFSDEIEGDYAGKRAFDSFNKDKHVRVFSYLVGRKKSAKKKAMKEMSCKNRGHFYEIETVGNIWDNVLKFINVLSRPLALSPNNNVPIYTPLYLDASGLGMMMTVSVPVFKKTKNTKDAALLGVTGSDIAVSAIQDQIPYYELGVNGYGFVINYNGFFLMHPLLKSQEGYLPSPANVYLEDLERSTGNDSIMLKNAMINGTSGERQFVLDSVSLDGKRFTKIKMNYFFQSMNSIPFSASIAVPEYGMKKLKAKAKYYLPAALKALNSTSNYQILIAPWPYCNISAAAQDNQELSKKAYPTAEEVRVQLSKNNGASVCNQELIENLLLSASLVTNATENVWKLGSGVVSIFIGTSAGYSRVLYSKSVPISRDLFQNEYYKHAVDYASNRSDLVIFSVPLKKQNLSPFTTIKPAGNKTETYVTVSIPVKNGSSFLSVLGFQLKHSMVKEMLLNATVSTTGGVASCSNNNSVDCYLVDENGYVVSSNGNEDDVGQFLGMLQGKLMETLSHNQSHFFKPYMFQDTQGQCDDEKTTSSDAMRLLTPFFTISAYFVWWTQTLISLLAQFTLYSSVSPTANVEAISSPNVSCTKNMVFYVLQDDKLPDSGSIACSKTCNEEFAISKVKNTNLALVVMKKTCGGSICTYPKVSTVPVKIARQDKCPVQARDRRLPDNCFAYNATEDTSKCGSATTVKRSLLLLVMVWVFIAAVM
ncbi:voltage-dependent calcium channel subunit alpha-2/delta-3-like [Rhopilema esculentum]|uniref:voltage-dependent calcium channel subunit alpha-2/delta-3-like n=1 Tax=Rhopilema esculentum TaxID=499914 RepID=UPI0031D2FB97|eukprot:gene8461-14449_t